MAIGSDGELETRRSLREKNGQGFARWKTKIDRAEEITKGLTKSDIPTSWTPIECVSACDTASVPLRKGTQDKVTCTYARFGRTR